MENISYGKIVLIGAGHVGSAILDSLLRMNLADEIVVINRNQKKALGVVLDASHTTAFAYSANANIRVGTYEDCKDAQIIINTAGPSIQPGNSRDRMVLLQTNVQVMKEIMTQITTYTRSAIIINVSNPMDILTYIAQKESGDIFGIYAAQVGKHFIEAGGVQKSTGTDQKISGVVEFLLCNISKNVHWI